MRAGTRFHCNPTRRKVTQQDKHLLASDFLAKYHRAVLVLAVQMKAMFAKVNADERNAV